MEVMLDGSVIETSEVQDLKTCMPMEVMPDGSVIETSEEQ